MRIIVPLVTMPVVSRALGSENLGVYSYTYAIAQYGTYFILLGLNQYGNREIAKVRSDKDKLSQTFWSIYFGQLFVGVLVTCLYAAYSTNLTGVQGVCTVIWLVWLLAEVADITWLFSGLEEFRLLSIRNTIIRIVSVVAIVLLVQTADDLWIYCIVQATAFAVNAVVLWIMVRGRIKFYRPSYKNVLRHIKPSLILFAPVIAISCYTHLNSILLGNLSDMHQVAFYDMSNKITIIPLALIQSLGTVLLPRMSNTLAKGDEQRALQYLNNSIWLSLALAFGLLFGIAGVSKDFVPIFFGAGFEACEVLMPLLALIIVPCAISSALGNQWLIPHERDGLYLKSVLFGAVANVVLCIALIPSYGAIGAVVATITAEIVVSCIQMVCVRRELPLAQIAKGSLPFFWRVLQNM